MNLNSVDSIDAILNSYSIPWSAYAGQSTCRPLKTTNITKQPLHCYCLHEVNKFPIVRRDLALLLDKDVEFSRLNSIAKQTETNLLKSVNLFDVYAGDKLPKNKKSYALSFILEDKEKAAYFNNYFISI